MRINPDVLLSTVGGKAYQLYRLQEVCSVPPFFVLQFDDPSEVFQADVQAEIVKACKNHNFNRMAVRSSATFEDSEQDSFAGIFETFLNVGISGVVDAIAGVLQSTKSPRAIDYISAKGLSTDRLCMSVIVQKQVLARVSGVCFSRAPTEADCLMVEACYGLGEPLVSGTITPDVYIIKRDSRVICRQSVGYQQSMLIADSACEGTRSVSIPFHRRNARKMTGKEIQEVARQSVSIEERLGFASADVEWAFEQESLSILQARPVTALQK